MLLSMGHFFAQSRIRRGLLYSWLVCIFCLIPYAAEALDVQVRGGAHEGYNRLVFDWPVAPVYELQKADGGAVTITFKGPAVGFILTPSARRLPLIANFTINQTASGTQVSFVIAQDATAMAFKSGTSVVVDVKGNAPAPAVPSTVAEPAANKPETKSDLSLTKQNVMAVLFERAQQSYAVLDQRQSVRLPAGVQFLEGVPGWRQPISDSEKLSFSRDAGKLALQAEKIDEAVTTEQPTVLIQPDYAAGSRILIQGQSFGTVQVFIDPILGDTLYAIATPATLSIGTVRHFAAFELLPTRQGIIVRPLRDDLQFTVTPDGLQITQPNGLSLSAQQAATATATATEIVPEEQPHDQPTAAPAIGSAISEAVAAPVASTASFFDIVAAQGKPDETFTVTRQRLQNAIAAVGDDDAALRAVARTNLTKFYISHGFGQEAEGILNDIATDTPDVMAKPEFRGLRGMASTLTQNLENAVADLSLPELSAYPDLTLWRAAAFTEQRDFTKASAVYTESLNILASYPEPFFTRFTLSAAETYLASNDNDHAKQIVTMVQQRQGDAGLQTPALLYIRGVIESRVGSLDDAKQLWEQAGTSNDMLARTRAQMALIDLKTAAKTMAPVDAAKQLEGLRFGWRGDSLELDLLQRLAANYAAAGQPDEALTALEKAKRIAANQASNDLIMTQQRKIFTDLFMSDVIDSYPPLKTLATYNRYKQFAPTDPAAAIAINNRLVDKMLKIDLLGPAADLLDQQLPVTSDAVAKAKLGARIAGIRLLNLEPALALRALDASEVQGSAADVIEERKLLRARAIADNGQAPAGLALLKDDPSEDAKRLAATISWRAKDWSGAAAALGGLVPQDASKLTDEQAQLVVRRAIAMTLAGDTAGLTQLDQTYGAAIKATPSATTFALLTAPEGAIKALAALPTEMKDVDLFKSFLETYRK